MNAPEALFPANWSQAQKQADLLKLAKSILLEPTGLTERELSNTFGDMFTHRLDDCLSSISSSFFSKSVEVLRTNSLSTNWFLVIASIATFPPMMVSS